MKIKTICITAILTGSMIISCAGQTIDDTPVVPSKDRMIKNFIKAVSAEHIKKNKKIIILEKQHCAQIDCKEYFENYKTKIEVLSMEDAFMRGYKNCIVIASIDELKGIIKFRK